MHIQEHTRTFSQEAIGSLSRGNARNDRNQNPAADAKLCRVAIAIAAVLLNVDAEDIVKPNRSSADICEARHVAMYLAHVVFQVSLIRSGAAFGRDRTTVAHAVRKIEDRRDNANFDREIERLESLARSIQSALVNAGNRDASL